MDAGGRTPRSVGQALVDQLVIQGVRHVFCVPGESYLPVLDALHDSGVTVTVCRNEGGAAMMADAVGRATGAPGVCMVTRGPGASNAMVGVHIAHEDSSPMILVCGQIDGGWTDRGAWQEMDHRAVFTSVTKWVGVLDDASRVGEMVGRAVSTSMSGRPGPVVLSLPKQVLSQPDRSSDSRPVRPVEAGPDAAALAELRGMLARSRRPMVIAGGSRWDAESRAALHRFADRWALPVATSYRRGPLFDAEHANYAGDLGLGANPKLVARVKAADLVLLIGGRLGQVPSQDYGLFDIPAPATRLVHIHADPDEIGQVYQPALAIPASPRRAVPALAALDTPAQIAWAGQAQAAHADYLDWSRGRHAPAGRGQLGRGAGVAARAAGARRDHLQRRGRLRRLAAPLLPLPRAEHPHRPRLRHHGLRPAGGRGDEAAVPRAAGGLDQRRRRLPDERPGVRHPGPVRPARR